MGGDRLGVHSARPGHLHGGLPGHDGEERAFLFGVQLVLQVRQQTSSLDTGGGKTKRSVSGRSSHYNDSERHRRPRHLSVIHSGRIIFSPLRS